MGETSRYQLTLPANPESISLARLFTATVLRTLGAEEALVEDAKLAVSELCSMAIVGSADSEIQITATASETGATISVAPFSHPSTAENVERLDIVTALFPSTRLDEPGAAVLGIDMAIP